MGVEYFVMDRPDLELEYLKKLRNWKGSYEKNYSMDFLNRQFKETIERPYKQLTLFGQLWEDFVPEELAAHAKLHSFLRGVLTIHVDSPAHKYGLDQLLRDGLKDELVKHARNNKPSLRKVNVVVAPIG